MKRRYALVVFLVGIAAPVAGAQQIGVSVTQARSSHRLLPQPQGASLGATWRLRERLALRAAYHFLGDDRTRVGRVCVGLIPPDPDACPEERIDDETSLDGLTVALVARIASRGRASLAVIPSASLLDARTRSRGQQTGNTFGASGPMLGVGAGAELSAVPSPRWPVAVNVGAHVGFVGGQAAPVVDGYSPFSESIRLVRLDVGVSLWKPRRAERISATRSFDDDA